MTDPLWNDGVAREVRTALAALDGGAPYRGALESLLLALAPREAGAWSLLSKEGRGAWALLLARGGGTALVLGDARSGALVALARAGFHVTAVDADPLRLRWARHRDRALAAGTLRAVRADPRAALPFADDAFDVVVAPESPEDLAEPARLARDELLVVGENRLGYKRSSGLRGDFRLVNPARWLGRLLSRPVGERSWQGWRRAVERPGRPAQTFALYPHARDFSHVVALDAARPRLSVGPKERANRAKVVADRAGLFPWLAPSILCVSRAGGPSRMTRVLGALAERLGEAAPEPDVWVATRGNTSLVLTASPGAPASEPSGRWALHVPHSPQQLVQTENHLRRLRELRARFPALPVPEQLFLGEVEGVPLSCERRLAGITAPQVSGDRAAIARLFGEVAAQLATLVVERTTMDEDVFEELLGAKFDLVSRFAAVPSTVARLARMRDEARERLLGASFPRVLYHSDLRGKHVQVTPEGAVLGYLDWGSSESSDLPCFDLLHLLVHERKQETGSTAGEAWRAVRDGPLRDDEAAALDTYLGAASVTREVLEALLALYPVLVGAMAERNWDFSRPRWLHANFGV